MEENENVIYCLKCHRNLWIECKYCKEKLCSKCTEGEGVRSVRKISENWIKILRSFKCLGCGENIEIRLRERCNYGGQKAIIFGSKYIVRILENKYSISEYENNTREVWINKLKRGAQSISCPLLHSRDSLIQILAYLSITEILAFRALSRNSFKFYVTNLSRIIKYEREGEFEENMKKKIVYLLRNEDVRIAEVFCEIIPLGYMRLEGKMERNAFNSILSYVSMINPPLVSLEVCIKECCSLHSANCLRKFLSKTTTLKVLQIALQMPLIIQLPIILQGLADNSTLTHLLIYSEDITFQFLIQLAQILCKNKTIKQLLLEERISSKLREKDISEFVNSLGENNTLESIRVEIEGVNVHKLAGLELGRRKMCLKCGTLQFNCIGRKEGECRPCTLCLQSGCKYCIVRCNQCKGRSCNGCLAHCITCQSLICKLCLTSCASGCGLICFKCTKTTKKCCRKHYCVECRNSNCYFCKRTICNYCKCAENRHPSCNLCKHKHLISCGGCHKFICTKCSPQNILCSQSLCSACAHVEEIKEENISSPVHAEQQLNALFLEEYVQYMNHTEEREKGGKGGKRGKEESTLSITKHVDSTENIVENNNSLEEQIYDKNQKDMKRRNRTRRSCNHCLREIKKTELNSCSNCKKSICKSCSYMGQCNYCAKLNHFSFNLHT